MIFNKEKKEFGEFEIEFLDGDTSTHDEDETCSYKGIVAALHRGDKFYECSSTIIRLSEVRQVNQYE